MTAMSADAGYVAIPVDHPDDPKPGDLCRVGTVVGVMAYNRLYEDVRRQLREHPALNLPIDQYTGQYEFGDGRKPVSFQPSAHHTRIRNQMNETAMPGSIVRYFDRLVGPASEESNAASSTLPGTGIGCPARLWNEHRDGAGALGCSEKPGYLSIICSTT